MRGIYNSLFFVCVSCNHSKTGKQNIFFFQKKSVFVNSNGQFVNKHKIQNYIIRMQSYVNVMSSSYGRKTSLIRAKQKLIKEEAVILYLHFTLIRSIRSRCWFS